MRTRTPFSALRYISLSLILIAIALTAYQLARFSRVRAFLPAGIKIAGVPVGGLDRAQAIERLLEVYSQPVELNYQNEVIQLEPSVIDFQLQLDSMLAIANLERTEKEFWGDFWDYLWGRTEYPSQIPINSSYSDTRLRAFLTDVSDRYDKPSAPALPIPGTVNFQAGETGLALDPDGSVALIENALNSLSERSVNLPLERLTPTRPTFQNMEVLIKQTMDVAEFDGLAGVYLFDLQTADEIHFAYQNGEDVPVSPDIAFTASSIIKVPIMISAFSRMGENPDPETLKLMEDMIDKSGNEAADWLMDRVVSPDTGPLIVTEDMKAIGLENTFLAGYFSVGSPLLALIETPANQRVDIDTDPDLYNQTTPSDIGMLLEDIYQCTQNGGGALSAVFGGTINQLSCQNMITYLLNNRLPVLLTAGLPEGTPIAHKHGWVTYNGVINTIGDAGIIYTTSANYILVVFLYHPEQLVWEPASTLIAEISQAVFNFYNLPPE